MGATFRMMGAMMDGWVPRVRQAKPGEGGRDDVSQR